MYNLPRFIPGPNLSYGISEVSDGNMSYSFNGQVGNYEEVAANRARFVEALGISPTNVVSMTVTHGTDLLEVTSKDTRNSLLDPDASYDCDALITREKGVGLFLRIADCIPMLLTDKNRTFVALIHGGWKNTDQNFISKVIEYAKTAYEIQPYTCELLLGPAIQKQSYLYDYFDKKDTSPWDSYTEVTESGKVALDNVGLTVKQALDSGIPISQIFVSEVDTYTDPRFFSHKRDFDAKRDDLGRFAIAAMLT